LKLVQTGEGWLAPIEKSRTREKGGLAALGSSSAQLDPSFPRSLSAFNSHLFEAAWEWVVKSKASRTLPFNRQDTDADRREGGRVSSVDCWSCSLICVVFHHHRGHLS
jgi:hypothetical protein